LLSACAGAFYTTASGAINAINGQVSKGAHAGHFGCLETDGLVRRIAPLQKQDEDQTPDEQFFSYVAAPLIGRALHTCR
jgi:hypothetical protein